MDTPAVSEVAVVGLADEDPPPRAEERVDSARQSSSSGHVQDVENAADEHVGVPADVGRSDLR